MVVVLAVIVSLLVALQFVGARAVSSLIDRLTPFDKSTQDVGREPIRQALEDASAFTAAVGTYQLLVGTESGRDYIPDFLLNRTTLLAVTGSVDAEVDFSSLGDDAVRIDREAGRVDVTLPTPRLDDPEIDFETIRAVSERGVLNRVGDIFGDGDGEARSAMYAQASADMAAAAAGDGELVDLARENTTKFLTGLLGPLGYDDVRVEFEPAA